jgi:hypothetical protein
LYNPNRGEAVKAEILFGKQRHGPTGRVILAFRKQLTRFDDIAQGMDSYITPAVPISEPLEEGSEPF